MAERGAGLFYHAAPPPQSGDLPAIRQWMSRELERIASVLGEGRSQGMRLDILTENPARRFPGMVNYFAAAVAGVGATEGLYEYRSDNTWHKL